MEPWARAMMMADEAEARGDAEGALEVMEAFAVGPDGEYFWRLWRAEYLLQMALLRSILPGWVICRWICNQAVHCLNDGARDRQRRSFDLAVDVGGGPGQIPGRSRADAYARIVDRDWVYRQVLLYELGGLEFFVRRVAAAELLAGADSIHEWARMPMGGYEHVRSTPDAVTWRDLASGEQHVVANIGCAVLVRPGEHVIGRLVPVEGGLMFEGAPLQVPHDVAHDVASRPAEWLDVVKEAHARSPFETAIGPQPLVTDVPSVVWKLALTGDLGLPTELDREGFEAAQARLVLDAAAKEVEAERALADGEVDVWACLGAALLDPLVVAGMAEVARPADVGVLRRLGELVAEPAASVCRLVATELSEAA